jgi:homogentisate 1,2-dioxygenase
MPIYIQRGKIPPRRHTVFRRENGEHTYEEHISRLGFSDIYSNVYHLHMPTRVAEVGEFQPLQLERTGETKHRHRHMKTFAFGPRGDWLSGRRPLMFNGDIVMGTAAPEKTAPDYFFKNATCDEVIFVHRGSGTLESMFGNLAFGEGDYVVVPRGVIYRMKFDGGDNRLFWVESYGPVDWPKHFRNQYGQLLEDAPYCERDIRTPEFQEPVDETGEFPIRIRLRHGIQEYRWGQHPFDLVGYDGYYYPWIFNIRDYMPKVGQVHLPPPSHLTFTGPGYVMCSFCPRLFDWEEDAIPIPYAHSNVDSDEVLYYVEGNFMSRKGIEVGSITLHPYGIPHGPQPGLLEKSLGAKETKELAVMVDTFAPLEVTASADEVDDAAYPYSWQY